MTTAFETEVCSRCAGTGQHSFNGEHSRCYKCDGKNGCRAYTKRGEAAKQFYLAMRNKPVAATEVVAGMSVVVPGWKWFRPVAIKQTVRPSIKRDENNNVVRFEKATLTFTNGDGEVAVVDLTANLTVIPTPEDNDAMIAAALAYQENLTKAGTPRKSKGL
jgi:hypothetical protein